MRISSTCRQMYDDVHVNKMIYDKMQSFNFFSDILKQITWAIEYLFYLFTTDGNL